MRLSSRRFFANRSYLPPWLGPQPAAGQKRSQAGLLIAVLSLLATSSHAQSGQPIVLSGQKFAPDALYLDVAKADTAHTDICQRIESAWNALNTVDSGVLDARSITGTQTCDYDPFLSPKGTTTPHHGILLLGNAVIQTTVPWVIPSFIQVEGLGETLKASNPYNTVLQATAPFNNSGNSTLCAANSVVCLGRNVQSFRVQIRHLTVDCNLLPGCVGVYNGAAEEGSSAQDVTITNAPAAGLEVNVAQFILGSSSYNGAVNSGPYRNISIGFTEACSNCTTGTAGVIVENTGSKPDYGGVVRGFDNVTVSGSNAGATLGEGFLIQAASTQVTNSHVEYFPVSVQIGGTGFATNGVVLSNLFLSNTSTGTGVLIVQDPKSQSGDVSITGLNFMGPQTALDDQVGGYTLTDPFIALYSVGHVNGSQAAVVISTSPAVPRAGSGRPDAQ